MALYIFDLDGTLVRGVNGVKVPKRHEQQEIIPGVIEKCATLLAEGHLLAIASNQGGVAHALCSVPDSVDRVRAASEAIGGASGWMISLYHVDGHDVSPLHMPRHGIAATPFYRKPQPGMLLHLMLTLGSTAPNTVFVGDMQSDADAARNAGIAFEWAEKFFARGAT